MWWNERALSERVLHARLGELLLWFHARDGELVVQSMRDPSRDDETEFTPGEPPEEADLDSHRFVLTGKPTSITIEPRLVERSVVARPQVPVFLPPAERVAIFITSPLLASLRIGSTVLTEMPIGSPPETWFGPSPVRGELCYASRTRGTRSLDELDAPPTRVVTQVLLENQGKSTLETKSVRLPMPRLSLAWDSSNEQLVTETVKLVRDEDDQAELSIEKVPSGVTLLAKPRDPSRAVWKQALAGLWS